MRDITRCVKVALKFLIAVVLVDVDLPYWTSKVEHLVAFAAIVSNTCTAHAQKRLFLNFRCKFRHHRSIPRPRFPVRVQNFGDLAMFYVDLCILYSEVPPYFYFRFVWPTDLESIPHASTPTLIIPTKFAVDMCIHCRVITFFLSADTSRDLDLLTLNSGSAWRVSKNATKLEDPTPIRSWFMRYNVSHWLTLKIRTRTLRMRRITWPVSRGSKQLHFWNHRPRFAYSLCNFNGFMMKVIKVICENNARPSVKRRMSFCACAKSRDVLKVP